MNRFKQVCKAALYVCGAVLGLGISQAQAALPDLGVDPTTITADIATGLGEWIAPMILLAFAVVVVVYGLRFFKKAS